MEPECSLPHSQVPANGTFKYFCSLTIQCLPLHYKQRRTICIFLWQNACSTKNSSESATGSFIPESENVCLLEYETRLCPRSYVISPLILRQVKGKEQILTFRSVKYCRKMCCITHRSKEKTKTFRIVVFFCRCFNSILLAEELDEILVRLIESSETECRVTLAPTNVEYNLMSLAAY
jgi:hypothetical protein